LRELEMDPMSHLAEYNFSGAELKWIKRHYQYLLFQFHVELWSETNDQEDCDESKAAIKTMMMP
jgi:hypothetical protein